MDKRDEKIAKKIIKFRHNKSGFNTLDRWFKIIKIKINNMQFINNIEGGKAYRVNYKYSLNLFNPLSWIIVVIPLILIGILEGIKEALEDLQPCNYSETIKIKD